ncbi:MAG: hypothetical protein V1720_09345 [bacterium]
MANEIIKTAYFTFWKQIAGYDINIPFSIRLMELMIPLFYQYQMAENRNDNAKSSVCTGIEKDVMNLPFEIKLVFILHEIEKLSYDEVKSIIRRMTIEEIIHSNSVAVELVTGESKSVFAEEVIKRFILIYNDQNPPAEIQRDLSDMLYNEALVKVNQKILSTTKESASKNKLNFFPATNVTRTVKYDAGNSWFD